MAALGENSRSGAAKATAATASDIPALRPVKVRIRFMTNPTCAMTGTCGLRDPPGAPAALLYDG
jgi:hypothetical protein